ncbi:F0F1 ATP synthase subunit epsilon [Frateuria aurantia]
MTTTLRIDIVSAEAALFSGEATLVVATGEMGELGITPRHAPLITRLKPGYVEVEQADGQRQQFYISGGILEVQPQVVSVLADSGLRAADLDEAAAQQARKEAETALAGAAPHADVSAEQRKLAESLAQLQALERMRRYLKH